MKVQSTQPVLKQRLQLWILPLALSLGLFFTNVSQAQYTNAYWDVNGITAGQGGTGSFSSSTVFWTTNSDNATANTGGPTGGGLFALLNGAAGTATNNNSGGYIANFGGAAGTVTQAGSYQFGSVNFLTSGYIWNIDGTGANGRTITTTNGVNLNGALTLANGPRGLNTFTFSGVTGATAVGLTGTSGSSLTLRNLTADSSSNSFTVLLSGGTISSNIAINVDIGAGSKILLGSQSSSGVTINSAITLNTNASGVALNITNSSGGGVVALNGVVSGPSGLVLDNTAGGKIQLNAANTYQGGTTLNNIGGGEIIFSNATSFGTGTITSSGNGTNYVRSAVAGLNLTNAQVISAGNTLRMAGTTSSWNLTNSGQISGAGAFLYNASGTIYLTGADNSFAGGVTLGSSGTLYLSKFGTNGGNSSLGTSGTITAGITGQNAGNGSLRWIGAENEISDKVINLGSGTNGVAILANGATNGSLTLNGNINSTAAGAKTLTFAGYNTNTLTLNGVINENGGVNSVTIGVSSSGTVVLGNTNNSFSGAINITNSTSGQTTVLSTANIGNTGANSALGKNGTINIGGTSQTALATLKYTGTGETSDKVINLSSTSGAILDQSGTGNLKFTSAMTATGVGAKAITLQGSTAGTGELAGTISDLGGNVISLNKWGSGNWTLSGNNSYSGNTTIRDAGVLKVASASALSQNSSLLGSSSASTTGTLDLSAGGDYVAKSFGTSGTGGFNMNFTNSSGIAATLRFTNGENYVTVSSSSSGGRTLLNQSSNLDVKFDGNIEIGSTSNDVVAFGGAGNFRVDGAIKNSAATGTRGLEKTGAGTLTLAGSGNNYNGSTLVKGGTLEVGLLGALPTASAVTVSNGATLKFLKNSGVISLTNLTVFPGGTLEQNLVTITSSGAVVLSDSTLKVNGTPTLDSYTLINGNSVTGTPTYSGPTGYQLSVEPTSVKLVKTVVVTGSTFDTTYPVGSEEVVGPNGLKNLMNYALGGTALNPSPELPVLTIDENGLTLTANIRNDDSNLNLPEKVVGQWAISLEGPWTDVPLTATGSASAVPNTTTKSFTQSVESSQPRKFLRFRVTK